MLGQTVRRFASILLKFATGDLLSNSLGHIFSPDYSQAIQQLLKRILLGARLHAVQPDRQHAMAVLLERGLAGVLVLNRLYVLVGELEQLGKLLPVARIQVVLGDQAEDVAHLLCVAAVELFVLEAVAV